MPENGRSFTYQSERDGNSFTVQFRFCQDGPLPGRVNAVTGHSGSGKSRLMGELALAACRPRGGEAGGAMDPPDITFSRVMAVSRTGMDLFPAEVRLEGAPEYLHLGLWKQEDTGMDGPGNPAREAQEAGRSAAVSLGHAAMAQTLTHLTNESSIARTGFDPAGIDRPPRPREQVAMLGTSQQMAVGTVLRAAAFLRPDALLLMDTPEAHLHPQLLGAFIRDLQWVLEERSSFAIVATSSPVVLQEVPGHCVQALSRYGSRTNVHAPEIETFGEAPGLIMSHVLGTDGTASGSLETLRRLAEEHTQEEIEAMFENGLSSRARAIIMQTARR